METKCIILQGIGKGFDYFIKEVTVPLFTSWPFIVLIIICLLREQLRNLIIRVKGLNCFGTAIDIVEQKGNADFALKPVGGDLPVRSSKSKKNKFPVPELPDSGIKQYFKEIESTVRKQLLESPYEDIDILIRDDVAFRISAEFEFLYRIIFGSQIEFLRQLERKIEIKDKDANKFFSVEMIRRKIGNLSYEDWISFLIGQTLINSEKKKYKLSDKGLAFLTFICNKNYDYKPYSL